MPNGEPTDPKQGEKSLFEKQDRIVEIQFQQFRSLLNQLAMTLEDIDEVLASPLDSDGVEELEELLGHAGIFIKQTPTLAQRSLEAVRALPARTESELMIQSKRIDEHSELITEATTAADVISNATAKWQEAKAKLALHHFNYVVVGFVY